MTIDEAIFVYQTNPARSTYESMGDRLYPVQLPQDPIYPAATFQQIAAQLTDTGQSAPSDLEDALVQFDCYALKHSQAKALAKALRADLSGFRGNLGGLDVGAVHFQNEWDFWGAEAKVWRVTVEFRFLFNQ